ncbi:MAG: hypothetical protein V3W34_19750 [Phycisphaerae bacterium]
MTVPIVTAEDQDQLDKVDGFLHDQRFNIDNLRFDRNSSSVSLPFEKEDRDSVSGRWYQFFFQRWTVPIFEHVVQIAHAISCDVEDPEQISSYTFEQVQYDPRERLVRILGCPHLRIVVEVPRLNISVLSTGKPLGVRKILTVLGCEIS